MEPIFKDLKVLELASVLAGPSVGQFFAELGAEVIKVENLKSGGDVTRTWKVGGEKEGDLSAYFCSCNWGKKSIAIDLSSKEGKNIVQKLAAKSDVVIASYKPGDAEKLGVPYEQLRTNNQQLIYGQITGYGSDNDRVGYDAVIQAEAGFMDLNGEKDGPPTKMPVALIDILAGHQLKEGLLLALLKRDRTGEGSLVEVSLIQTAIASLANQATNWLMTGKIPTRKGSAHPNIAPYGKSFTMSDGRRILLAIGSDRQFEDLTELLGIGQEALGNKFLTNPLRVENRVALNRLLEERMAKVDSKAFLEKANHKKIPAGVIQNLKEVFDMKEARELMIVRNGLSGVESFVAGRAASFKLPASSLLPPPHFGEHTEEILKGLQLPIND
jgi:crotonobetainyl-CoA:carnitine CoA-transferase CaiB-like acyl-CoA transferase